MFHRRVSLARGIFASVAIFLISCPAIAGTLGTSAQLNWVNGDQGTLVCYQPGGTCSGTLAVPGATSQLTYDAYGVANYGSLGAYIMGSVTPGSVTGTVPTYAVPLSDGYFIDSFTFTGSDLCGGVPCAASGDGTVELQFLINGSTVSSGDITDQYCISTQVGTETTGFGCTSARGGALPTAGSSLITTQPLPIVFGQASTFSIALLAYADIFDLVDSGVSVTMNYADTATLAGFIVLDSNGDPLTSFNVSSGSGTAYPDVTLPEPSMTAPVILALFFLAFNWAFRRRTPQA